MVVNKYHYPPLYEPVTEHQTMATREFQKFFFEEFDTNLRFYKEAADEDCIFEAYYHLKRKVARPDLSLARLFVNLKRNKKLFFGAPNPLFVTEDIVLSHSLEELQELFDFNIDYIDKYSVLENWAVWTEPIDYLFNFKNVSNYNHHKMFSKKMMYSAALTRKLLKIYKTVGLACENGQVRKVRKYIEDPNLPEFTKIFHQKEYYKKIDTVLGR